MTSNKVLARTAGILYLAVGVLGGFSEYVRTSATVPGDAAATARNVVERASLFHLGFVADLVAFACFLAVGLLLYVVLRPVDPRIALAMLLVNAVSVPITVLNMLNQLGAVLVATDPAYTAGLSHATAQAIVALLLEMHRQGYLIGQIFFGVFLLPLGYLVFKSGLFPKVLGVILIAGSAGYLAQVAAIYAAPDFQSGVAVYFGLAGGIAEIVFLFWLVIAGAREEVAA